VDEKSTVAVCGEIVEACICEREPGHEGVHECACGGQWAYDADGSFQAVRLPGSFGGLAVLAVLDFTSPLMDLRGVLEGSRLGQPGGGT
jgi:hypothetical protein